MSGKALRERAGRAAADPALRRALAFATDHMAVQRTRGIDRIANFEELRRSARAVRAATLARLPDVLATLTDRIEAAGGRVFFAADAAEACRYVVEVAQRRGARRVAKSKSMVTEEIGLNAALAAAGLEVMETDLGEWIVQLRGEPPSHIIAPAVHLSRGQVAELFRRHGGEGLTDDPEALTAFARQRLREVFLSADIGISGGNFAVAETGTICMVTNEGNGRMVTSLPPVHIAIVGLERVVETWEHLDLMMSLLARSSTGQDLTVYTTMITGPRRAGEVDGPEELHVVIVDNGRSSILGGPYRGPIGAVLSPLLQGGPACDLRLASSLCGACYEACPVMIPLQDLLLGLRRDAAPQAGRAERALWGLWSRAWSRPRLYRATARLARWGAGLVPSRLVPRWGTGRDVPRPRRQGRP
ncbi:MAG: lactate utilization protein [Acidimicrobiia bacterium]|nr:lactate utilization protein [Acidimicrobiia bacterium]